MQITRENYEAFFLDYHEGNLSASQSGELMDFLTAHPDLKTEFDNFEIVSLDDTLDRNTVFPGRESIKKPFVLHTEPSELDGLMIAHFEGDLTANQSAQLVETAAADPNVGRSFRLFALSRTEPDLKVVFEGKKALKKYTLPALNPIWRHMAVAAMMLGFIGGLYFLLPSPDSHTNQILSVKEPAPVSITEAPISEEPKQENTSVAPEIPASEPSPTQNIPSPQPVKVLPQSLHNEFPAPVLVATLDARPAMHLQTGTTTQDIELRDEFAWFSWVGRDIEEEWEDDNFSTYAMEGSSSEPNYTSLASLARTGLERTTGINFERVEREINSDRLSFWDLAGAGLAGISQITGTSLTVDKERNEDGRITMLAIGDRFRIKR